MIKMPLKVDSEVPKTEEGAEGKEVTNSKYPTMTFQPSLLSSTQTALMPRERKFLKVTMMVSQSNSIRQPKITSKTIERASKAAKKQKLQQEKIQENKKLSISGEEVLRVSG